MSHNVGRSARLLTTVGDLLRWNEHFVHPSLGDAEFTRIQQEPGKFNDGRPGSYALGLTVGAARAPARRRRGMTPRRLYVLVSGLVLNITPGQDTLYIVGRTVAQGRRAGVLSVMGISSGSVVHALAGRTGPALEMHLPIKIETRTGDTSVSKRQRQRHNPPHILLTTPPGATPPRPSTSPRAARSTRPCSTAPTGCPAR